MIQFRSAPLACALLGLAACGGGNGDIQPSLVTTQIFSNERFDGDIEQTSASSFTVTQGMSASVQSVFAGIDPVSLNEFRAFLDFPLTGSGGVPADAIIDSAYLEVFIDDIQPLSGTLPLLVELVAFQPPTLIATDFDRTAQPPLAAIRVNPSLSAADKGTYVPIDVTALMVEAQRRGLVDFQVRIMEDLGPAIPVILEIDDTIGASRSTLAPLLTVTYF